MSLFSRVSVYIGIFCAVIAVEFMLCRQSCDLSSEIKSQFRSDDSHDRKKWEEALAHNTFPKDFLFGVTTSAYQTEGTWNLTGESLWDYTIHAKPDLIKDGSNADVAADSYHKYKEDIRLAKSIGSQMFKISLSWTRILPDGFGNNINQDGIQYYNNVINEMTAYGIEPMVTLLHEDLPNRLQKWGGLLNPLFADWFTEYARIAFTAFGDRVKYWITINEPTTLCTSLYGGELALAVNESGVADYYCGHHVLLAHSEVYHMYNREFRKRQKGKIGITDRFVWYAPVNSESDADLLATKNSFLWYQNWLTNPIFSAKGDYPSPMKYQMRLKSALQGYSRSRLPTFTEKEIREIKGSADFLGVHFYGSVLVQGKKESDNLLSFRDDASIYSLENFWDKLSSWAFPRVLHYLNTAYNLREIYITESAYADADGIEDLSRAMYFHEIMSVTLKTMKKGINIRGYLIRPLIDSFEWLDGYRLKRGLFHVDFDDPNRTRTPRLSSKVVAEIYKNRSVENTLNFLGAYFRNKTVQT